MDWGYVVVPEDRANPDGPGIRLPVVIFRSVSETPAPDPVVLLVGGPGQALEYPDYTFRSGYAEFLKTRDFILNEQRAMRGLYALCERWGAPAAAPYEDEAVIGRPAGDDVRDALMDKPIRLWLILSGQWAEAHCLILLMY